MGENNLRDVGLSQFCDKSRTFEFLMRVVFLGEEGGGGVGGEKVRAWCVTLTQTIEGNYLQQSLYLVFILILLTSVFFSTFTHVCHFIVFKSKFHFDLFFILNVVRLILCFNYSIIFLVNSHSFLWYSFGSLPHYDTYLREFYYANNEALSIKTNTSCVKFNTALKHHAAVSSLNLLISNARCLKTVSVR